MLVFIPVWLEALVKLFWNKKPNSDCIQVKIQQKKYRQSAPKMKDAEAMELCIWKRLRRKSQRNNGLFSLKNSGGTKRWLPINNDKRSAWNWKKSSLSVMRGTVD